MATSKYCQSCSLPMDGEELWGTEKDGTLNREYCKYCYQHGAFTDPHLTLEKMRSKIIGMMDKEEIPLDIIEAAIMRLPSLKRWSQKNIVAETV